MEPAARIEQYAQDLFFRKVRSIRKTYEKRAAAITSNWSRKGLAASNLHFQELANNSAEQADRIIRVLIHTRVAALDKHSVRVDAKALNGIRKKAYSLCKDEQTKADSEIIKEVKRQRMRSLERDCSTPIANLFHEINVETDREIRIRKAELTTQAPESSGSAGSPHPLAYVQYCRAVEHNPELKTDDQIYDWLSEEDGDLPERETWKRNVRKGRKTAGTQKYRRGRGVSTRSVVRRQDLDSSDLRRRKD